MEKSSCIVLSSAFPDTYTGTGFAARSLLPVLGSVFVRVDYLAVAAPGKRPPEHFPGDRSRVVFHPLRADARAKWKRFAKSLGSRWPAAVQRYVGPALPAALHRLCDEAGEQPPVLFVLDAPLYWPLLADSKLRSRFSRIIHWSLNVSAEVFLGILAESNPLMKAVWGLEVGRLKRYEREVLENADVNWTVTNGDADSYRSIYRQDTDGVLGIRLDEERFEKPITGDPFTLLYLGSFDVRKRKGIAKFVHSVFPALKARFPKMRLHLGGKGSEEFEGTHPGVRGFGFVADEETFMAEGLIIVNPQESGSGIKLKSLHALADGKVLLTTPVGAQGIPGNPGQDYLFAERVEEMGDVLGKAITSGVPLPEIAEGGRAAVRESTVGPVFDEIFREMLGKALESATSQR